jgi:arsenate reductase
MLKNLAANLTVIAANYYFCQKHRAKLVDKLKATSESLIQDFEAISDDRKSLLDELSIYIAGKLNSQREVNLIFICTHNSRRSHMAQIWAQAAAYFFEIKNIKTFSGGTQKTAFNSHAVDALKKAGFKIKKQEEGSNPKYRVKFSKKEKPLVCFSKKYSHKKNPHQDFVAVMTCSDADESCPVIVGAEYRTTIKYDDPKIFDSTDKAAFAYEERSLQIGTEMLYAFKKVAGLLKN